MANNLLCFKLPICVVDRISNWQNDFLYIDDENIFYLQIFSFLDGI